MRISDWSSDVCSSDLTFAEWSRLYADVLWEADQASPLAKGDALLVLQDIMAGRTSRALARSAAARAAAASGAAGLAAERDARSEGHTSELQSLMRISYAVFCLKKNKNHIKQRSN